MSEHGKSEKQGPDLAVTVENLHCAYGSTEAVRGLSFQVPAGRCYGLFGRNGAGKSTTIKCLLKLLRPDSGRLQVCGFSPAREEVAVKSRVGYVPENVSFHPWMTTERVLRYHAAFRTHWNYALQRELLQRFELDLNKKVNAMSKGMRSQLALLCAVCHEPELLLLDEPTSGLDPIVRREFLQTVIGAYMDSAQGRKTVLVSTHLIGEWEGLIDEFTIIEKGRARIAMETDQARRDCRRIYARWPAGTKIPDLPRELGRREPARGEPAGANGETARLLTTSYTPDLESRLRQLGADSVEAEPLNLEEIFVALGGLREDARED